jgi:chromate reductase, NAD(P)H dehydrogenase (quinone)
MNQSVATRIVVLVGSLRAASYSRRLLQAAIAASPDGVELEAWEGLKRLPPFDEDDEFAPGSVVAALREAILVADALLVVTPEYNGSIPGQLKNAIDWASRPREQPALRNKPAAVIGASPSRGGARTAQEDTRRVLARAGAHVLKDGIAVARAHLHFDRDGLLTDPQLRVQLGAVIAELARFASSPRSLEQSGERQPVLA